ncbi:uncharacterized protein [Nothobranchius furzeri]|uniref:uncharacterized protein isoform X2 n=1 Tax=Nothobranchius furzeri TaxID=105023 RepID=UPI003904A188
MEQGETKKEGSKQMLSCVGIEANIDEEEFNNIQNSVIESSDDIWSPNRETEVDSSSEEDETIEMDSGTDDSGDEDYTPYTHIRTGAALQKTLQLETLQEINIEDTVHDCNIPEATDRHLTSKKGLPQRYKLRPEDPRRYGLLSGVPAPSTEELLQHLRTCGDGKIKHHLPYIFHTIQVKLCHRHRCWGRQEKTQNLLYFCFLFFFFFF